MHTSEAPTAETGEAPKIDAPHFPEFYSEGGPLQHIATIKTDDTQDLCDFLAELRTTNEAAA